MIKEKHEIIKGAIAGGFFGASLGALLTGKSKGALAALIAGAAIGASIKALKEAEKISIPVLYEEDGVIYKLSSDGTIKIFKKLNRHQIEIPSTFILE